MPWPRRLFGRMDGMNVLHGPEYPTRRIAVRATFLILLGLSSLFGVMCGLMLVYSIDLPQMDDLVRFRPNTTTELLDIHGREIGSFALERRVVLPYTDFPPVLRQALISIEDKSFESNWGVNLVRAVGAAWRDLHSRSRAQGSSTITMQLARNLFLSNEKTYGRKIQEILLAVQIERVFTKDQIFQLYANQIYLGHGTYGFEAASEYYFSRHARDLNLPEAALLAALPKGAEYYSPINHPQRALTRRNLVLSEMRVDGKITRAEERAAAESPLGLRIEPPPNSLAPYFVEEVRRQLEKEYGAEEVHGAGLRVYTTLDLDLQQVAKKAVLDGTAAYERRHGWKGHLQNVLLMGTELE
jgi:penicillin-binding protein 1A